MKNNTKEKIEANINMSSKTGEVLFCGMTDWKNVGRKAKPGMAGDPSQFPNIFVPTRVGALAGVAVTAVCGGSAASHCMVIAEDGRVFTWGRNETGQLGHGDTDDRAAPTEVKALEGIKVVGGSCGKPIDLMDTKHNSVAGASQEFYFGFPIFRQRTHRRVH